MYFCLELSGRKDSIVEQRCQICQVTAEPRYPLEVIQFIGFRGNEG